MHMRGGNCLTPHASTLIFSTAMPIGGAIEVGRGSLFVAGSTQIFFDTAR